ncbi:MAG: Cys-tRNA(Pro) deacylase [Peptococcales bacterium]
MKKTNAARILEKAKIPYKIHEYQVDEDDLSAENVALKAGWPLEKVFKTLVAKGDKTGVIVACLPGGGELNLKSLASLSGNKKVELVPLKEVLPLTGYIRGGVSPIGLKKNYPVYIHGSAFNFETILISAGARGYQIEINPRDLQKVTGATIGQLTISK